VLNFLVFRSKEVKELLGVKKLLGVKELRQMGRDLINKERNVLTTDYLTTDYLTTDYLTTVYLTTSES